jgi:hypothetical protein
MSGVTLKKSPSRIKNAATFGAGNLTTGTTTRYLPYGYVSGNAPTTPQDVKLVAPEVIDTIGVYMNSAGADVSDSVTITLRKNGAPTALALVISPLNGTVDASTTGTPVTFAAGERWGIQVDKSGTLTTAPMDVYVTIGRTT